MPDQVKSLETPDPLLTSEGAAALAVTAVADVYILFGSNLSNEKQTALATLITSLWVVAQFIHAAMVRKGRAQGGGLVGALVPDYEPVPGPVVGNPPSE